MGDIEMVAVKYLKRNAESEMELTFQRELEILSNFDHPNVIPLVGVCLDKTGPMCLILGEMLFIVLEIVLYCIESSRRWRDIVFFTFVPI